MQRVFSAAFAVLFLLAVCRFSAAEAMKLYVHPRGSDAATGRTPAFGSPEGPFASLPRAQLEIGKIKQAGGLPEGAIVYVGSGDYHFDETWKLDAQHSGTAAGPVVYWGVGTTKPRLIGGKALKGFRPYQKEILACDLKANGLAGKRFAQLFFRGRRQTLARYPNLDPNDPHGGAWGHVAMVEGDENHSDFFYGADENHSWAHPEDGRVHIFGGYDWAFKILPLKQHLPEERKIVLGGPSWGPLRVGDRYFVDGLLEELDAPGEWCLDPRSETLYFWPPAPVEDDVIVPVVDTLIAIEGAEHVTVRGFVVEACRKTGIEVTDCRNCLVAGNLVRNCGGDGIAVRGGEASGAQSNEVCWTGHGGIRIEGGDRKTLAAGNNFADNNYVHHTAAIWTTYRPAVSVAGVGNRVSHNLIHDVPHAGITLSGNENVVEYNHVHHVNLQSGDTGGIYFCSRDWTQRGNVIRYNIFHHVGGFGKANSWAPVKDGKVKFVYPHFTWGIYLDDPTTGTHVYGNVLYQVPICGMHNHGGRDNLWENNIIVDCPAFQAGRLSPDWSEWPSIFKKLKDHRDPGSPYLEKYPEIAQIADTRPEAMSGVKFLRNIVYYTKEGTEWLRHERSADWGGPGRQLLYQINIDEADFEPAAVDRNCIFVEPGLDLTVKLQRFPKPAERLTWDEWRKTGADAHSLLADPKFVDPGRRDYRLQPDSPALALGFEPIPVEKIGPYRDEYRSDWPIAEAAGVAALGDFTTEYVYEPPQYRRVEARQVNFRDGLGNLFAKAAAGQPIKIAYFGGGIHGAGGWRRTVMDWFRRQFGKVEEIDGSISDCVRGSGFSVYRFGHDVLRHKPDLVLVDFASDDQTTTSDEIMQAIEGVVRQAWKADPTLDLVFLYAFRSGDEDSYAAGLAPHAVSAYERIAEHYGIPSISMGCEVAERLRDGKLLIQGTPEEATAQRKLLFSRDGVRPTADGDQLYAGVILTALERAAKQRRPSPHTLVPPLRPDHREQARQVPITQPMLSGTWRPLPADDPLVKQNGRHFDTIWYTDTPGAKLSFKFKGTSASLFDLMGPDTGQVRVTVDGKEVAIRKQVDPWCTYQRLAALPLASGLPDAVHTVTVELLAEPPDRTVAIDSAKRSGKYDPKMFEGVALRCGSIRLVGELAE